MTDLHRRKFLARLGLSGLAVAAGTVFAPLVLVPTGCSQADPPAGGQDNSITPLDRDNDYWREILPADRYRILFREGTEPAFSSPLDAEWRTGTYICAACFLPLFSSADKYDSGTGWPSFTRPLPGIMGTKTDYRLILPRTEYHCIRCTGHQGHVFNDGPEPTGQRWCNNGLALEFVPLGEGMPELRG